MAGDRDGFVRGAWQSLVFLALAIGIPALCCRKFDMPARLPVAEMGGQDFDPASQLGTLKRNKPDWVLIGNSMLNSRIEYPALSKISGWETRKVAKGGSQSALWYLFLKNIVIKSGARPALVTVFFRNTDLTWPDFRVGGLNEPMETALHGPEEPAWQQVLLKNNQAGAGLAGQVRSGRDRLFPSKDLRANARRQIQSRSFRLTRIGTEANSSVRRAEMNDRFSLAHLRHDLGDDRAADGPQAAPDITAEGEIVDPGMYEDGPVEFDGSPDASFLPHFIALAKEHGIQLHFHRVKRRPLEDGTRPDTLATRDYMNDLRAYLQAHGCHFTDESQDRRLTLDMYADGDHISGDEAIQERYLKIFWERAEPIVKRVREARPVSPN